MWMLILIVGLLPPKVIDSYPSRGQCNKALMYEQELQPKSKYSCILKTDLFKIDKVLRDK